jgi:hyperosmotically inducible periplasmic protein
MEGGNMQTIWHYMQILITVLFLTACAATPTDESTGEYVDDATITAKVKTALLQDPEVSGLAINVDTFKGTVQLSGFANAERERRRAETLARSVAGVQSVQNSIELKRVKRAQ